MSAQNWLKNVSIIFGYHQERRVLFSPFVLNLPALSAIIQPDFDFSNFQAWALAQCPFPDEPRQRSHRRPNPGGYPNDPVPHESLLRDELSIPSCTRWNPDFLYYWRLQSTIISLPEIRKARSSQALLLIISCNRISLISSILPNFSPEKIIWCGLFSLPSDNRGSLVFQSPLAGWPLCRAGPCSPPGPFPC